MRVSLFWIAAITVSLVVGGCHGQTVTRSERDDCRPFELLFNQSVGSPPWKNGHCCGYYGGTFDQQIECEVEGLAAASDASNKVATGTETTANLILRVTAVSLVRAGLAGPISPSLGGLDRLRFLDLSGNALTGSIPPLDNLTVLETLAISQSRLQGPLPSLAKNTALITLRLDSNNLNASLPRSLTNLTLLQELNLASNNFSGLFPSLRRLTQLRTVDLHDNPSLSGPFPDISALVNLTFLDVSSTNLGGNLDGLLPSNLSTCVIEWANVTTGLYSCTGAVPAVCRPASTPQSICQSPTTSMARPRPSTTPPPPSYATTATPSPTATAQPASFNFIPLIAVAGSAIGVFGILGGTIVLCGAVGRASGAQTPPDPAADGKADSPSPSTPASAVASIARRVRFHIMEDMRSVSAESPDTFSLASDLSQELSRSPQISVFRASSLATATDSQSSDAYTPSPTVEWSAVGPHWAFLVLVGDIFEDARKVVMPSNTYPLVAVMDYTASASDEISLRRGEPVKVKVAYRDGWALSQNLRTLATGIVPLDHLAHGKPDAPLPNPPPRLESAPHPHHRTMS
ncbi:L domain-like protein [Gonapodya prolifera JEL478]|uniref:L domain-like protein n=1 Tax=Gonapodya prolifera (strain JEL478) TaxID=1344416 RepID=A0A139APG2_GONPJ|nr:L domain-like protein [Gonapodya prolifera JEL478]|eukprot:KXS18534.1 L domain-like protein [Gonapodya prolifera JEL478]